MRVEHLTEVVNLSDCSLGTLFLTEMKVREYHVDPKGYNPPSLEENLEKKRLPEDDEDHQEGMT